MNTPAHLLLGGAVFSRPGQKHLLMAALAGAILPDLSLYLMAGVSLFILDIPARVVFDELYFSTTWQTVFAIDNSFVIWGALLGLAVWRRIAWAKMLCGAALLHLACDLPLHHDDGRAHFWPLTNWVFESPLSYWDSGHHAGLIAPGEGVIGAGAAVILFQRFTDIKLRLLITVLLAAEIWVIWQWFRFF